MHQPEGCKKFNFQLTSKYLACSLKRYKDRYWYKPLSYCSAQVKTNLTLLCCTFLQKCTLYLGHYNCLSTHLYSWYRDNWAGLGDTLVSWVMMNLQLEIISKYNANFFALSAWSCCMWTVRDTKLYRCFAFFDADPLYLAMSVIKTFPKGLGNVPHTTTHHTAFSWESSVSTELGPRGHQEST